MARGLEIATHREHGARDRRMTRPSRWLRHDRQLAVIQRAEREHERRLADEYCRQRGLPIPPAVCALDAARERDRAQATPTRVLYLGHDGPHGATSWKPMRLAIQAARRILRETDGRAKDSAALAAAVATADSPERVREATVRALWQVSHIGAEEARRFWYFADIGEFPSWELW
jgi:hypothetical protein